MFAEAYKIQRLSHVLRGKRAIKALYQVIDKYKAIVKLEPDNYTAFNNLGLAHLSLAKLKTGHEAEKHHHESMNYYKAALEIKPDGHVSLNNWGISLLYLAEMKDGEEAEKLYRKSMEKYEAALDIKPDYHMALVSWGCTLLGLAALEHIEDKEEYYTQAESILLKADSILPGCGSYNLACVGALRGDSAQCKRWLENAYEHGTLQSIKQMQKEPDFEAVRHEKWFKNFIGMLKRKKIIAYIRRNLFID